jgi:hypothetical protein
VLYYKNHFLYSLVIAHLKVDLEQFPDFKGTIEPQDVVEFELYLMEALNFETIVYNPYRILSIIHEKSALPKTVIQSSWFITNDSFKSDVSLLYSPQTIALAAIYIALISIKEESFVTEWFSNVNIPLSEISCAAECILQFYCLSAAVEDSEYDAINRKVLLHYELAQKD